MCRKVEDHLQMMMHHEIVYPDTIAAVRGLHSLHGHLDEEAAYFWNHIAYCVDEDVHAYFRGHDQYTIAILRNPTDKTSPHVVCVLDTATRATLFTVRGSNTPSDFMTILDVNCSKETLQKRLRSMFTTRTSTTHTSTTRCREFRELIHFYMMDKVSQLPCTSRVHVGIFMHAFKCLLMIAPHLPQAHDVHLYGHSLGAACASLLYVWIRELDELLGLSHRLVTCACMASPMFCNDAAWESWFKHHDTVAGYVHYYTIGDPFVKRVPGLVGLTKAVSTTHHVGPSIINCQSIDNSTDAACSMKAALIAHSCFYAGNFVQVHDHDRSPPPPQHNSNSNRLPMTRPIHLGRPTTRILMSPKYTNPNLRSLKFF